MKNKKIITLIILTATLLGVITFSQADALTWSGETQLTFNNSSDMQPWAMQAQDGKIWVVWAADRSGQDYDIYYKTFNGVSWSSDTHLVSNSAEDSLPSICQAANGTIWVAWSSSRVDSREIFYKTSNNNGVSWSPDKQLTNNTWRDYSPAIIQNTVDGKIWVFWHSNPSGGMTEYDIYYKIYDGLTWSSDIQLTVAPGQDTNPAAVQTRDDTIWVFWTSDRDGTTREVYYKTTSNYGASWSADTRLTNNLAQDTRPSVMQVKDGKIWVVWNSLRDGDDELFYNTYNGTNWGSDTQLTFNTAIPDIEPSVLQDKNYKIWIFFSSYRLAPNDNYELYYKTASIDHDVGLLSVTPSAPMIYQGYNAQVQVKTKNYGVNSETFSVTVYYNSNIIGTQTVTLASCETKTLTFPWDTTSLLYGNFTISASISGVPSDEDPTDNHLSNGTIFATIPGDVNCDGTVDILDGASLSAHWYPGPPIGPLGYDPKTDINGDGVTDVQDAAIISANWHRSW